jgi:phospholipid-binding lipoprotein MlaA
MLLMAVVLALFAVGGAIGAEETSASQTGEKKIETQAQEEASERDLDPWEPFNVKTFWFNRQLDRYVLKPAAKVWDGVLPDPVQRSIANMFDNLEVVRRVVNNALQLKVKRAGLEMTRFTINSTIGVAGLFDPARRVFGIEKYDEDTGQTFGVYGAKPGPYLVLPFLPPLTVRDGVGFVFDLAMNPLTYLVPTGVIQTWERAGITTTELVNDRSRHLEFYQNVEETALDLYSAVRNGYLQRREAAIKE